MTYRTDLIAARAAGWRSATNILRTALFGVVALAVAGCQTVDLGLSGPTQPAQPRVETIGDGSVTVALLLPTSAAGGAGQTARSMRQAAELALSDIPGADLRIIPIDTQGNERGADAAARHALAQNAALIIGPLFAGEVRAVGSVARTVDVPVIAFSTDQNVAADGVYLLSFLPEADVERIVSYAARNGRRSFAALLPEGGYGAVVEAAFQQAVSRSNGRIVAIERYGSGEGEMQSAVRRMATVASGSSPQIDALLVPDTPQAMARLAPMLAEANIDPSLVQLLGSGQWNDETAWQISSLEGGWFAGPQPGGWQSFRARFQERFGAPPSRNATLAYDAVSLAAALARLHGTDGFTAQRLTDQDGFAGIDGVFRFRRNGNNQRGLSILEIREGSVRVRDTAPDSFGPGA